MQFNTLAKQASDCKAEIESNTSTLDAQFSALPENVNREYRTAEAWKIAKLSEKTRPKDKQVEKVFFVTFFSSRKK